MHDNLPLCVPTEPNKWFFFLLFSNLCMSLHGMSPLFPRAKKKRKKRKEKKQKKRRDKVLSHAQTDHPITSFPEGERGGIALARAGRPGVDGNRNRRCCHREGLVGAEPITTLH